MADMFAAFLKTDYFPFIEHWMESDNKRAFLLHLDIGIWVNALPTLYNLQKLLSHMKITLSKHHSQKMDQLKVFRRIFMHI